MSIFLIELLGVFAIFSSFVGHQIKKPSIALFGFCAASLFWSAHFYLLGEVAFIVTLINAARYLVGSLMDVKYLRYILSFALVVIFALIAPVANTTTDYLPLFATAVMTVGILCKNKPLAFRISFFAGEFVWLYYGIIVGSYSMICASTLLATSILISIYRYNIKPKALNSDTLVAT